MDDELFDGAEGERLKQRGMALAAGNNKMQLELARLIAAQLGRAKKFITADDVGRILKHSYDIESLGPSAGSLFAVKADWRWTGRRMKSSRKSNHRRELKIWEWIR